MSCQILSFGRSGDLGDLYDMRTQAFTKQSILLTPLPPDLNLMQITPVFSEFNSSPNYELFSGNSLMDKMKNLRLSPQIKLCFLTRMISPEGIGKYMLDEKSNSNEISRSVSFEYQTCKTFLDVDLLQEILPNICISNDALVHDDSTHILTEITWGIKIIVTIKREVSADETNEFINHLLDKMTLDLVNSDKQDFDKLDLQTLVKIFSDAPLDSNYTENQWETLKSIHELIHNMPESVKGLNDGKGVPLSFTFHPITALQRNLKMVPNPKQFYSEIESSLLDKLLWNFEIFLGSKDNFFDTYEKIWNYKLYFSEEKIEILKYLRLDMQKHVETLEEEIKNSLIFNTGFHISEPDFEGIQQKLAEFQISDFITTVREMGEKLPLIQTVKNLNGTYIDRNSYEQLISDYSTKNMFILCTSAELIKQFETEWNENWDLFTRMMKEDKGNGFSRYFYYVYDYELKASVDPAEEIKIVHYKNGKLIVENLLEAKKNSTSFNMALTDNLLPYQKLPAKTSPFLFQCPGVHCPNDPYEWICFDCFDKIMYGFDMFLYCKCGKGTYSEYKFICGESGHGKLKKFITDKNSQELFIELNEIKVKNILLLGSTGVGKSTWINSFANFVSHATLAEAQAQNLICPIPTSFEIFDEDDISIDIYAGEEDENECFEIGSSGTKFPNVYTFEAEKLKIKLIDTPGIGDTNGIETQKINFQNILNVLSNYSEIHGILILLKCNESRINTMFEYCIKGLLANLHVDACKNISFVFTHSRGASYKPGDTMRILKKLLSTLPGIKISTNKDNYFCMDSEPFRYLAASSCGVQFNEENISDYTKSWNKSQQENQRLIRHIGQLKPHKTTGTLSLNETRNLLLQMIIPIAEITRNIYTNVELNNKKILEIENSNLTEDNLMQFLKYQAVKIKMTNLSHPVSVCGNEKCIELITLGNVSQTNYKTICCHNCTVKFVTKEAKNQMFLYFCKQMDLLGNCKNVNCRHPRSDHLHITYKCHQVEVEVVDEEKEREIEGLKTQREKVAAFVNQLKQTIEDYEEEKKIIEEACAKLGLFLKNNAIIPFNDSLLQYLDHVIEQEKIKGGEHSTAVLWLNQTKKSYQEQFAFLEKTIDNTKDTSRQSSEIKEIVLGLYNLKKSGRNLREIVEKNQQGRKLLGIIQE